MKLQLDENTLNAYINEAIKQELGTISESKRPGRKTYRVDFDALGLPDNADAKDYLDFIKGKLFKKGKVADMISGKYGSDNTATDWFNTLAWAPGKAFNSHNKQLRKQLIKDLRDIGYTDDQISEGLSNGAIEVGNYDRDTDKFLPFNDKKQQRNLRRVAKHDNDIKNKYKELKAGNEENPNEVLPDDDSEVIPDDTPTKKTEGGNSSNGQRNNNNIGFDTSKYDDAYMYKGDTRPKPKNYVELPPEQQPKPKQEIPDNNDRQNQGNIENGGQNQNNGQDKGQTAYPWDNITQEQIDAAKRRQAGTVRKQTTPAKSQQGNRTVPTQQKGRNGIAVNPNPNVQVNTPGVERMKAAVKPNPNVQVNTPGIATANKPIQNPATGQNFVSNIINSMGQQVRSGNPALASRTAQNAISILQKNGGQQANNSIAQIKTALTNMTRNGQAGQ